MEIKVALHTAHGTVVSVYLDPVAALALIAGYIKEGKSFTVTQE